MRFKAVFIAAALALMAQSAAARVTIVQLTGVARGLDNGHVNAPSPFGVRQLVTSPSGSTAGVVNALPFSIEVRIDESLGGVDLFPNGQGRYGSGADSPVTAIFSMNGFSYAFGNLYTTVSKGFGDVDSFYLTAVEERLRPPMTGDFLNVRGSLDVTLNLRSQVFLSRDFAEPASWSRGAASARGDAAFGNLSLSLQGTSGSEIVSVLGPLRSANLDLELTGLSVAAAPVAVPEPGPWLLMILGFGGVGAALRRRPSEAAAT